MGIITTLKNGLVKECQFEIWDRRLKGMRECGNPASFVLVGSEEYNEKTDEFEEKNPIYLCDSCARGCGRFNIPKSKGEYN